MRLHLFLLFLRQILADVGDTPIYDCPGNFTIKLENLEPVRLRSYNYPEPLITADEFHPCQPTLAVSHSMKGLGPVRRLVALIFFLQ